MAVRLRMKKLGRLHRPFFRVVAVDTRTARDGRVIEYLGHYDPLVKETDARAVLKNDRIDYWLSVGALPSDRVGPLMAKYGSKGTHLEQQQQALERLKSSKPSAPAPFVIPKPKPPVVEAPSEVTAEGAAEGDASAEAASE